MYQLFNMHKYIIHIILGVLLVLSTSGITITRHYCGDNLVFASVASENKNCCNESCNNCRSESVSFKVSDTFSATSYKYFEPENFSLHWLVLTVSKESLITLISKELELLYADSPPNLQISNSFLQVFRC